MHQQNIERRREQPHRRKTLHRVERQLLIEGSARSESEIGKQQRVAVGCRPRDDLGPDNRSATGAVVYNNLRAHALAVLLRGDARHDVHTAAGRVGNDDTHRLGRVRLGCCLRHAQRNEHGTYAGAVEFHVDSHSIQGRHGHFTCPQTGLSICEPARSTVPSRYAAVSAMGRVPHEKAQQPRRFHSRFG
jgi:hypothetical protein